MRKIFIALILRASVVMAGQNPSKAQFAKNTADPQFKVLNPWAEVDPITPRGISPRLNTPAGKKIGLFANFKRASRPIVAEVEKRLKAMYPDCETQLLWHAKPAAGFLIFTGSTILNWIRRSGENLLR
jgi:hypothetical protein